MGAILNDFGVTRPLFTASSVTIVSSSAWGLTQDPTGARCRCLAKSRPDPSPGHLAPTLRCGSKSWRSSVT